MTPTQTNTSRLHRAARGWRFARCCMGVWFPCDVEDWHEERKFIKWLARGGSECCVKVVRWRAER